MVGDVHLARERDGAARPDAEGAGGVAGDGGAVDLRCVDAVSDTEPPPGSGIVTGEPRCSVGLELALLDAHVVEQERLELRDGELDVLADDGELRRRRS